MVLGKVTYFYKESKSNIKERKKLELGGGGNSGWRGLELVIFLTMNPNLK